MNYFFLPKCHYDTICSLRNPVCICVVLSLCRRLSCLCGLELTVEGPCKSLALGMVLSSINAQLPQLRSLSLTAKHSWTGVGAVWEQLGQATKLTHLCMGFQKAVDVGGHIRDLAPLSALTALQSLSYTVAYKRTAQMQDVSPSEAGFLRHLTALTSLCGDIAVTPGMLENVCSCTALRFLCVQSARVKVAVSNEDWQTLGQLSLLTRLHVQCQLLPSGQDPQLFHSALQRLTGLQYITAGRWAHAAVPVLATLPHLTCIGGIWEAGVVDGNATCAHVVRLHEMRGFVPFTAFPNVEVVVLSGPFEAASWEALSSWCPKVKEIKMNPLMARSRPCFPSGVAGTTHVAAVKGLAQLTCLTHLHFNVSAGLEVLALANAVQHVEVLKVGLLPKAGLDWSCLLPLVKLTHVKVVSFRVGAQMAPKHVVQMLLSGFAHARSVTLAVSAVDVAAVQEAVDEIRAMGLDMPEKLVVRL
jgi:hypothetical protein